MRKLILLVLMIAMSVSGYQVSTKVIEYQQANNYYETIQQEYVQNVTPSPSPTPTVKPTSAPVKPHTTKEQAPISVDFASLQLTNSDVVGWIYSEDTVINYPVLQTSNNVYYLRHLLDKSYSANGSIFLDTLNNKFNDENSILYGHHMRNGSMFASIDDYKEQEYYNNHPVLWLLTPTQNYQLKPFAGLVVSPDRTSYFITDFGTKQEKVEYMKYAIANSEFKTNVKPNSADRIVTLATCDYTFTNARFILLCILIPCIS